ncbi:3',5'-cyclic adenosine monophosphate phosphodiesterase CpdA [Vibrio hyugaensis]|uniref:3',5'-cyclic adenosine monophosphate phosphodiesterase CpdA n=1 Tax=Vibrio hyugaensis TaxID=1534743 RepID=A0ABQ5Y1K0_9VIBR|nr:3',5'-cyclic adenosine monophosphate phosphodiesterase CpdA [Vibrio hyugaensis]
MSGYFIIVRTVIQISDCHLSDESSFNRLRKALNTAQNETTCDTLLLTGDLCCNPRASDYQALLAFLNKHIQNKHVYAIAGNHDDFILMKEEFRDSSVDVVEKAEIHGREVLFLDSSAKPLDEHHPLGSGRVDNRGVARFKRQLRHATNPIVVVHHPIIPVGSDWMKAICLENDASLLALLTKHRVQDVICGHGHDALTVTKQGVTQHMAPATAYGFDHSIDEYNRSEKIGVSKICFEDERINVETIWL